MGDIDMGLLDQVLGAVVGQGNQQGSQGGLGDLLGGLTGQSQSGGGGNLLATLLPLALALLQNRGGSQQGGGLGGLLQQFQQAGLGQQVDSWVGTGQNLPLSAEQLVQALGRGRVSELASKAGVSEEEASGGLASLLPELVNQMTPQGSLPSDDGAEDVLGGLRKQLGF